MRKTGVIVDAYSTGRFLAGEFRAYGYDLIHVQSMREILPFDRPSFRPGDFIRNVAVCDGDWRDVLQAVVGAGADFVIPGCESGVILADRLSEAAGLPTNGTARSLARRDKDRMAGCLRAAGLRAIAHVAAACPGEAIRWRDAAGCEEVVVKPLDSAGTEDVYFCRTDAEITVALGSIIGKVNGMGSVNELALVQERIRGDQYTANLVSCEGRHYLSELWTYSTREVPGAGSVCELEALLEGDCALRGVVQPYVFAVLDALGILNGPAHVELFVDRRGPVLIEAGARMQGSMSRTSRLRALGHDHVSLTAMRYAAPGRFMDHLAGNDPYRRRRNARIVSLISDCEGVVRGFSGLERLKRLQSFSDCLGFPRLGETVSRTRDLASTAGLIYLVHENAEVVDRDSRAIARMGIGDIVDLSPAAA